jgi:hypothetical protein
METRFSELLEQIYSAVAGLEAMFPGRHFTPDGHMVGSIGEAIAAYHYGVELYPASHRVFDGRKNGKEIQIKATQNDSVELKAADGGTLLVFKIHQDGSFEDVYNGNMNRVWQSIAHKKATNAGEISIPLNRLRALQKEVREEEKITRENRQS